MDTNERTCDGKKRNGNGKEPVGVSTGTGAYDPPARLDSKLKTPTKQQQQQQQQQQHHHHQQQTQPVPTGESTSNDDEGPPEGVSFWDLFNMLWHVFESSRQLSKVIQRDYPRQGYLSISNKLIIAWWLLAAAAAIFTFAFPDSGLRRYIRWRWARGFRNRGRRRREEKVEEEEEEKEGEEADENDSTSDPAGSPPPPQRIPWGSLWYLLYAEVISSFVLYRVLTDFPPREGEWPINLCHAIAFLWWGVTTLFCLLALFFFVLGRWMLWARV